MSSDIYRILNNPETAIRETNHPLTKLLRHILADRRITPMQFNELLAAYLDNPVNGIKPGDRNGRSSTRGNRIKEITKRNLTWDNFMKAMMILDPEHIEFSATLHWRSGEISYHSIGMTTSNIDTDIEQETMVNGQTVTTRVPPTTPSHWSGLRTGGGVMPRQHDNVTYTFGDTETPAEEKGDEE